MSEIRFTSPVASGSLPSAQLRVSSISREVVISTKTYPMVESEWTSSVYAWPILYPKNFVPGTTIGISGSAITGQYGVGVEMFIGLMSGALQDANVWYRLWNGIGQSQVYYHGGVVKNCGVWPDSAVYSVTYDGVVVRYFINGTLQHGVSSSAERCNIPFYGRYGVMPTLDTFFNKWAGELFLPSPPLPSVNIKFK